MRARISPASRSMRARSISPKRPRGACPIQTFSATERSSNSTVSWWMAVIPAAAASWGEANRTGSPSMRISPPSGRWIPVSTLTIVDLPAPFSPTSAVTVPACSSSETPESARTPGNVLVMPSSASTGGAVMAGGSGRGGPRVGAPAQKMSLNCSMFDAS